MVSHLLGGLPCIVCTAHVSMHGNQVESSAFSSCNHYKGLTTQNNEKFRTCINGRRAWMVSLTNTRHLLYTYFGIENHTVIKAVDHCCTCPLKAEPSTYGNDVCLFFIVNLPILMICDLTYWDE